MSHRKTVTGTVIATGVIVATLTMLFSGGPPAATGASHKAKEGKVLKSKDVSLALADQVVHACKKKAQELGVKMNICVVDAGANLKAFNRMDGAWIGSIDIAIKKARTSRLFDMPTGNIGELSQPGKSLYNIEHSNGGLITFPGGVPLKTADGTVIGAVGVSGSTVDNDHAVASAGAKVVSKVK